MYFAYSVGRKKNIFTPKHLQKIKTFSCLHPANFGALLQNLPDVTRKVLIFFGGVLE